jgi:transglutaminase-like putative cysteine protease
MQVTTTHRSYWRGESKAVYTGKGWEDIPPSGLVSVDGREHAELPIAQSREGARTEKVEQAVVMLREEPIPVLFGAGPIASLQALESDDPAAPVWNPEEWELVLRRPAQVASYAVVSETLVLDEEALRRTSARPGDGDAAALAPYLQLPDSLPARVRNLAEEIVSEADNDYDRAKLLETYLKETYPYTNTPDVSRQRSRDVVDAFLFEIREGYCDYYSTAFVVMARSVGLPARWVKGYATGYDPAEEERMRLTLGEYQRDPVGPGTYIVRNADAHSWAEVYFEGFGWVPFEPTAGFAIPLRHAAEEAETGPLPESGGQPETSEAGGETSGSGWKAAAAAVAGAVSLAAAGWFGWRNRERLAALWRWLRYRGATPNERIVRETHRLVRTLRRKGFRRERHETMRETFARWGLSRRDVAADLEQVLRRFEAARYGPAAGDEESYREFVELVNKIRKAI